MEDTIDIKELPNDVDIKEISTKTKIAIVQKKEFNRKLLIILLIIILIIIGIKVYNLHEFYINTRYLFPGENATFIEFLIGVIRGE